MKLLRGIALALLALVAAELAFGPANAGWVTVDMARETTNTVGTGPLTVTGASGTFKTIEDAATAAGVSIDGKVVSYGITDGSNRESGRGTYNATTNTLTRCDAFCTSSNSNNPISLSGTALVSILSIGADFRDSVYDDAHGIYDGNANEQLIFQATASAVNYLEITNAVTGSGADTANHPSISAAGSDSNIGLTFSVKGDPQDPVLFNLGGSTGEPNITFRATNTDVLGPSQILDHNSSSPAASDTIGFLTYRGRDSAANETDYAAIGGFVLDPTNGSEDGRLFFRVVSAGGFSTEMRLQQGLSIGATTPTTFPGSGNLAFGDDKGIFDNTANEFLTFNQTASAINQFQMTNNAAGSSSLGPDLAVTGDDTNISLGLTTKGTGRLNINANNTRQTADFAGTIGYTINNLNAAGNSRFQVSAANFSAYFILQSTQATSLSEFTASHGMVFKAGDASVGDITFTPTVSGGQYKLALTLTSAASAVNSIKITPAATGSGPIVEAIGSDTDIDLLLTPKGAGNVRVATDLYVLGGDVFLTGSVIDFGSGDVTLTRTSNALTVAGGDLFVPDEDYGAGWNGDMSVPTKDSTYDAIEAIVSGGITWPVSVPDGAIFTAADNADETIFAVASVASATNYLEITNSATGAAPILAAAGGDTNIGFRLSVKGTGAYSPTSPLSPIIDVGTADEAGFVIKNTSAGPTGPSIVMFADSASPANNDYQGSFAMWGRNSSNALQFYSGINGRAKDITAGSEDGELVFFSTLAGGEYWPELIVGNGTGLPDALANEPTQPGLGYLAFMDAYGIKDGTGDEVLIFQDNGGTDVNWFEMTNSASGVNPTISVGGGTANLGLTFAAKGDLSGSVLGGPMLFQMGSGFTPMAVFTGGNDDDFGGPIFVLYTDSASPAAADYLGGFEARGRDSAATNGELYASIFFNLLDPTNGSEDGKITFTTNVAGGGYVSQMSMHDGVVLGSGTTYPGNGNLAFADDRGIFDDAGNEQLIFQETGSAVNQWEMTNSATGGVQRLGAAGGDTDIGITLASKGADSITLETNGTVRSTITSGGNFMLGTSATPLEFSHNWLGHTAIQQQLGTSVNTGIAIGRFANQAFSAAIIMGKSRGTTIGSMTIGASGDDLGRLVFDGTDGTDFETAAEIFAEIDGTPGANDMPGRITFATTPDNSVSVTPRWVIDATGTFKPATDDAVGIGNATNRVADLFLAEGGTINWDNGDCILTQTGNSLDLTGCTAGTGFGSSSQTPWTSDIDADGFSLKFDDDTGIQSADGSKRITVGNTETDGLDGFNDSVRIDLYPGTFPSMTLQSVGDGTWGPTFNQYHDSASPDVGDQIAANYWYAKDSGGNATSYVKIFSTILDPTNGSEDGDYRIEVRTGGSRNVQFKISDGVAIGQFGMDNYPGLGNLGIDDSGQFKLFETNANGSNYFAFVAPDALGGDVTCTIDASGKIPDSCVGDGSDATGSLSDADYGDITVSSSGTVWDIDADAVTPTELAEAGNYSFTGSVTFDGDAVHIFDTNASHDLIITPGSDLSADRVLTLTTGDAARTITLSGNPTLSDWFDQSVKTTAAPTFDDVTTTDDVIAGDDVTLSAADGVISIGGDVTFVRVDASDSLVIQADVDNDAANTVISYGVDGNGEALLSASAFYPGADGGNALGINDTNEWNGVYLNSGTAISWNAGDVTITHSANDLAFAGVTGDYSFDDTVGVTGSVTASVDVTATAGDVTSGDDVIVGDDAAITDDLSLTSDGALINIGAANDCVITHSSNTLTLTGCTAVGFGGADQLGSDADRGDITISGGAGTQADIDPDVIINGATPVVNIQGNDAGAVGPVLKLQHDSASAADGDIAGDIQVFAGADDEEVGRIALEVDDGATTTEDTRWRFFNDVAGSSVESLTMTGAAANFVGSVTAATDLVATAGDVTAGDDVIAGDDVLLSNAGVINFGSGDCTLTEGTDTLTIAGTCSLVTEVVVPDGDNTRDLGSTAATWATAHINSIELANGTANTLTATGGVLSIEGVALVPTSITLTGGVGIAAIGDLSANRTITWDPTETNSNTFGSGTYTALTFDAGATDPTFTMASNSVTVTNAATFSLAASTVSTGNIELNHASANTLTGSGGVLSIEGAALAFQSIDLTAGVGLSGGGTLAANRTFTFDATEISSLTWGAGAFTTMTFNAGATDPVFTFGSDSLAITATATLTSTGSITAGFSDSNAGTGNLGIDDSGEFRMFETEANGDSYFAFIAPDALAGNVTCTIDASGKIPDSCVGDGTDGGGSLADLDYGDITVSSSGTVWNIDADTVTPTELAEAGSYAFTGDVTFDADALHIFDTNASHDLIITPGSDLSADRVLTLTTGDAARTVTISGNTTISQDYSATGNPTFAAPTVTTLEVGAAATDTTLSRSAAGVLAVEGNDVAELATAQTWTATQTMRTINPSADSTYSLGTSGTEWLAASIDTVTVTTLELGGAATTDTSIVRTAAGEASIEGDAIKHAGRQTIPLLAGGGTLPSGGGIAPCVGVNAFDSGSNDVFMRQCSFAAATDNAIYYTFFFPKGASESTDLVAQIDWTSATTTDATDDVIWTAAAVCFSNDDAINGNAFPAVDQVTDTQTAAGDYLVSGEITAITPAGTPAEGDGCVIRFTRDADAGGDNFNGTAELIAVRLFYVDNASSDD